jgi:hypothetical protein
MKEMKFLPGTDIQLAALHHFQYNNDIYLPCMQHQNIPYGTNQPPAHD